MGFENLILEILQKLDEEADGRESDFRDCATRDLVEDEALLPEGGSYHRSRLRPNWRLWYQMQASEASDASDELRAQARLQLVADDLAIFAGSVLDKLVRGMLLVAAAELREGMGGEFPIQEFDVVCELVSGLKTTTDSTIAELRKLRKEILGVSS